MSYCHKLQHFVCIQVQHQMEQKISLLCSEKKKKTHIHTFLDDSGLKMIILTFSQTSPGFYVSAVQVFLKNTVGKGEIACNKQFLLFSTMFSTCLENFLPFSSNLKLSCANSFSLEASKICCLGKS